MKNETTMNNFTSLKKIGVAIIASLLFAGTTSAQNSVYDVVPGSGPKKKKETSTVYDVTKKKTHDGKVYYPGKKRKHLPPGQAKKIYGGSAKDYAPGQVKKGKGWYWNKDDKKWYRKHKKGNKHTHHKHK